MCLEDPVEDVALLAKVLIKKDNHDKATIHYSSDDMLVKQKKDLYLNQNLYFTKQIIGN